MSYATIPECESPDVQNERMRQLEEQAEYEMRKCRNEFREWCEGVDTDVWALLMSYSLSPDPYNFTTLRDTLVRDYRYFREGRTAAVAGRNL